jgi:hypothetical protein
MGRINNGKDTVDNAFVGNNYYQTALKDLGKS